MTGQEPAEGKRIEFLDVTFEEVVTRTVRVAFRASEPLTPGAIAANEQAIGETARQAADALDAPRSAPTVRVVQALSAGSEYRT